MILSPPETAIDTVGKVPSPAHLTPTIFHEPWWLATVTAGRYEEVSISAGGVCVGRLPYLMSRRFGMTEIVMPMLTHFLGPAVDEGTGSRTTRLLRRISITNALIERLPRASNVWMKFHYGIPDTLAFQRVGYRNEVQFTIEIEPAPEHELWSQIRDTTRRVIRRASESLAIKVLDDPGRYLDFYEKNLRERGRRNHYSVEICRQAIEECLRRGVGHVIVAEDELGELNAGVFSVWDHHSEYYLMSTRRPKSDNGAIGLVIWAGIRHAATLGLVYDLDGVGDFGDFQFLTRFGGVVQPRYCVRKSSAAFRALGYLSRPVRTDTDKAVLQLRGNERRTVAVKNCAVRHPEKRR